MVAPNLSKKQKAKLAAVATVKPTGKSKTGAGKKGGLVLSAPKKKGAGKAKKDKLEITGLEAEAARLREIAGEMESLSAEYSLLREKLIETAKEERRDAEVNGTFFKTCAVESDDGDPVLVVFQDKYGQIAVEHDKALRRALGDQYEQMIVRGVELKPQPGMTLARLRKILGSKADAFEAAVTCNEFLTITSGWMEKRATLRDALDDATNEAIDEIVEQKQYSPQVKLK